MRRRRLALVMGALLTAGLPTAPATRAEGSVDGLLAEAARFRAEFGFRNDSEFVSYSVGRPPDVANLDWGIPLTDDEAAEVTRRSKIPEQFGSALAHAEDIDGFAGAFLDHSSGGTLVILFAGSGLTAVTKELASYAPRGAPFEVRLVEWSRSELKAVEAAVIADNEWLASVGLDLAATGVDTVSNRLAIGLRNAPPDASRLVVGRYGDAVVAREDDYAVVDACTVNTCWPQKGGIKVQSISTSHICTSGFTVRSGSPVQYGLLTAGHCVKLGGTGNWKHDSNAHTIGTTTAHTYFAEALADAAIIKMNYSGSPPPTTTLNYFVYENSVTHAVSRVAPLAEQIVGAPVCMSGWGTRNGPPATIGRRCGTITADDERRKSCEDTAKTKCLWIQHQYEMSFDTTGGDSGGPVSTGLTTANGLLTDSVLDGATPARSWYSPLVWAIPAIDARPNELRWRVCLNATCTSYW